MRIWRHIVLPEVKHNDYKKLKFRGHSLIRTKKSVVWWDKKIRSKFVNWSVALVYYSLLGAKNIIPCGNEWRVALQSFSFLGLLKSYFMTSLFVVHDIKSKEKFFWSKPLHSKPLNLSWIHQALLCIVLSILTLRPAQIKIENKNFSFM